VDFYVRCRMFDLLGMLTLGGKLERDQLAAYLRNLHGRLKDAESGKIMQGVPHEFDPFGGLVKEIEDWTIRDDWEDKAEAELTPEDELALGGQGAGDLIAALQKVMPKPVSNPYCHVGRNDPCPCGSGKKFKRCCGQ
jgi:hypothetical protein